MKTVDFTIYDQNTGEIKLSGNCAEDSIGLQTLPSNCALIEEKSNHKTQYVENGKVVDKPEKPNEFCEFDYSTKQWVQNLALLIETIKSKRNLLLKNCDWTQLPDVPEATRLKYQAYRQALRDITLQDGYPQNTIFPELE